MKKLIAFSLAICTSLIVQAQTTVLQENWTSYAGTAGTAPAGYYISNHGNYTTVASSGTSGPNSYRFGVNNATVITPQFAAGADTLKFWIKHNVSGVPANDTLSTFYAYESLDSLLFTPVDSIRPLPTNGSGKTYSFKLLSTTKWLKFVYKKVGGNLAFDDLKVLKNPPVIANFSNNAVCEGNCTQFNDGSTSSIGPIILWGWDFNNDQSIDNMTQNPCYTFLTAGTHTVTLIVADVMNNLDTITKTVVVNPKPTVAITSFQSPAICAGDTICFSNTGSTGQAPLNSVWTFYGGATYSGDTVCHVSTPPFLQVVWHTITDANGCKDSSSYGLQVTSPSPSNFTANNMCFGGSVCVSNTPDPSTCGVSWNFGDGFTSTNPNVCHTYAAPGTYSITQTVTSCGSCPASVSTNPVTIYALPNPTFSYMNAGGNNFNFTDLTTPVGAIAVWSWNFGDPSSGGNNTSSLQNPSHNFSSAGTYTVGLFVVDTNGCQGNTTIVVSTTGIEQVVLQNALQVQDHESYLQVESKYIWDMVTLRDLQGKLVLENREKSNRFTIDKNSFNNGIYFIELLYGPQKITRKIIIRNN